MTGWKLCAVSRSSVNHRTQKLRNEPATPPLRGGWHLRCQPPPGPGLSRVADRVRLRRRTMVRTRSALAMRLDFGEMAAAVGPAGAAAGDPVRGRPGAGQVSPSGLETPAGADSRPPGAGFGWLSRGRSLFQLELTDDDPGGAPVCRTRATRALPESTSRSHPDHRTASRTGRRRRIQVSAYPVPAKPLRRPGWPERFSTQRAIDHMRAGVGTVRPGTGGSAGLASEDWDGTWDERLSREPYCPGSIARTVGSAASRSSVCSGIQPTMES